MSIPLIISICLTLTLVITAGAFYWGLKIGEIIKISGDNQTRIDLAIKQIDGMEEVIEQLNYQLDSNSRERTTDRPSRTGWDPSNPLSAERR